MVLNMMKVIASKNFVKKLKGYIVRLRKGKRAEARTEKHAESVAEVERQKEQIRQNWLQLVSKSLKEKIIRLFRKETSTATLSTFTCASCAEECLHSSG